MIVELTLMKIMQGFQIRRMTRYSDYAFDELPQQLFKRKGAEIKEADAMMRGEDFWNQYRQVPLTETESSMDVLVKRLEQMPGFKYVIFVLKAFVENFVETGPWFVFIPKSDGGVQHIIIRFLQVITDTAPLCVFRSNIRNAFFRPVQKSTVFLCKRFFIGAPCILEFM